MTESKLDKVPDDKEDGSSSLFDWQSGPKRPFTPLFVVLGIVAIITFFAFRELENVEGWTQAGIVIFVAVFACLAVGGFYYVVIRHPFNWYPPSEWEGTADPKKVVEAVAPRAVEAEVTRTVHIEVPQSVEPEEPTSSESDSPNVQVPEVTEESSTPEREFVLALVAQPPDLERAALFYEQVQEQLTDADAKLDNQLFFLAMRFRNGDIAALGELEALAKSNGVSPAKASRVHLALGLQYQDAGSFQRAEEAYAGAVELAVDEADKVRATMLLATAQSRLRRQGEAIQTLKSAIASTSDHALLADLYERLAGCYEDMDQQFLRALALEKSLQHKPEDTSRRFSVARAYDASEHDKLSFLHYKRILQIQPQNAGALNNVGVQYAELGMPALAVDSYVKAYQLGETLAASNMAYLRLRAGFLNEARQLLEDASKKENPDPNVARALAAVSDKRAEETKTDEAITNVAREEQDFLLGYAEAAFSPDPPSSTFAGTWSSIDGTSIVIEQDGERVTGSWTGPLERVYSLKATAQGRISEITGISWKSPTNQWSFESIASGGYAYLSADWQNLHIMGINDRELTFMSLRRVN